MRNYVLSLAVLVASLAALPAQAQSQKGGCGDKVCKLVETTVEKKVVCYGCKCEDFCVPGKSCVERDGLCGCSCGSKCACKGSCSCGSKHAPYCQVCVKEWTPGCAKLMTKKVLIKYEKTVKVPGWKWEVVSAKGAGCGCAGACGCASLLRPAPADAVIGQTFEATDEEVRLASASLPVKEQPEAPAKKTGIKSIFGSLLK